MTRVSKAEFDRIRARASARKARRIERRVEIDGLKALAASQDCVGGRESSETPPDRQNRLNRKFVRFGGNPQKRQKIHRPIKRGPLKAQIVRLLGLLARKANGPLCALDEECPDAKNGAHFGTLAYHITPAGRGDSVRLCPDAVVWACRAANYGEFRHRSLYRDKHIKIFGKDRVEMLEALAREVRHYTMAELLEMRDNLRKQLESM